MKILHTADWHLGQRFCDHDRIEELAAFLKWLITVIQERHIDALVHAGDVFDTGNPPNYALEMYYNFLRDIAQTECSNVIITGGNHDSPATLNAPKSLLRAFNIHVVGAATGDIVDEKIILKTRAHTEIGVVCAVPFLRDKDIRYSIAGETADQREQRIVEGIREHYRCVAECVIDEKKRGLPVIATGHLFAAGSELSDAEHPIVGNLGAVGADIFPDIFGYVALGHIHRPQTVGGREHIRYSGSPIPLSFKETEHKHQVVIVEFMNGEVASIEPIDIPVMRHLIRFAGTPEKILENIGNFTSNDELIAWGEVTATLSAPRPQLQAEVRNVTEKKPLEILQTKIQWSGAARSLAEIEQTRDLKELSINEVFRLRCESKNYSPEKAAALAATFAELLSLKQEHE